MFAAHALRDHGGDGPPRRARAVADQSAADPRPRRGGVADAARSRRWAGARCCSTGGRAASASRARVGGHVETLLLPLLEAIGEPAALIGYCLGGTMAIAAANLAPCERVVTIAAPWHFAAIRNDRARRSHDIWRSSQAAAEALGALPMEVLQARILVARSGAHRRQVRRVRPRSNRPAPRRGGSSSSRNGRTQASPCPIRPRANCSRNVRARLARARRDGRSAAERSATTWRAGHCTCSPATTSSPRRKRRRAGDCRDDRRRATSA